MNLYELTKEQLIEECKRLQSENEKLNDELDNLSDCYTEMENDCADAVNALNDINGSTNIIRDMDWFKFKLENEGLLTPQLESFIEYYLKYHNQRRG